MRLTGKQNTRVQYLVTSEGSCILLSCGGDTRSVLVGLEFSPLHPISNRIYINKLAEVQILRKEQASNLSSYVLSSM